MDRLIVGLTLASALGCGLMAGFFFAFSVLVMRALGTLPPAHGIAAMQAINIVVINPRFLGVFLGTAASSALLAGVALVTRSGPEAAWLAAGGMLYLIGTFGVTIACNVPRNDALAKVDPASAAGAALWADYLVSWTAWNHVRTVAALAATAALTMGLSSMPAC